MNLNKPETAHETVLSATHLLFPYRANGKLGVASFMHPGLFTSIRDKSVVANQIYGFFCFSI
jgi:hypothetical protein